MNEPFRPPHTKAVTLKFGDELTKYPSTKAAAIAIQTSVINVSRVCRGVHKTVKGYQPFYTPVKEPQA